jgi:hypothetical protein
VELDHVLIAVTDLDTAARRIESRYGLMSILGGRHPGWGTANRIVPLGDTYLELVAVVDEIESSATPFGRWVTTGASKGGRPIGWVVRTNTLDATAGRLGLTIGSGSRLAPTGERLQWRSAGIQEAATEPFLPFFIEWAERTRFPGSVGTQGRLSGLRLEGDEARLRTWLGEHTLPITVRPGTPAVSEVVISSGARELVLGGGLA